MINLTGTALAQSPSCPPPGFQVSPPLVSLDSTIAPTLYRNDRTRSEIGFIAGDVTGIKRQAGLTQGQTQFRARPVFRIIRLSESRACVILERVEAHWDITAMVVDIASQYRPGSCAYTETRIHENQHVDILRRTLVAYAPRLKARLSELAAGVKPFLAAGDGRQATEGVSELLQHGAKAIIAARDAEAARDNGAIDTVESYRAITARCQDW